MVSGAVVSTMNVREAGVGSALPAASIAADLERVLAVGERVGGERRGAGREGAVVDAALERARPPRRR